MNKHKGIGIVKVQELIDELEKYKDCYVTVGKKGGSYRDDQKIINIFYRAIDDLVVLNIENYDEEGMMKYFCK